VRCLRSVIAYLKERGRAGQMQVHPSFAHLFRFLRYVPRARCLSLKGAKALPDLMQHGCCVQISHHDEHRIARYVKGPVIVIEIISRDAKKVLAPADGLMAVGMPSKCGCRHFFAQHLARLVLAAVALG